MVENRGMSTSQIQAPLTDKAPTVGFVSLGCPKALTDSELILTQLRAEGYETSKTFAGADLVIVNTCGFIDDAVRESLDAIGEALAAARADLDLAGDELARDRLAQDRVRLRGVVQLLVAGCEVERGGIEDRELLLDADGRVDGGLEDGLGLLQIDDHVR